VTKKACSFCGSRNFRETRTQYIYRHDGKLLIVEDVPCEQCEYCGEQYFKAEVLKKIEQDFLDVYAHRRKARSEVTVPVEQFV
jgi:YgiT-type zinc finger domain-containing protein